MAGFQVIIYGRIWVITEDETDHQTQTQERQTEGSVLNVGWS